MVERLFDETERIAISLHPRASFLSLSFLISTLGNCLLMEAANKTKQKENGVTSLSWMEKCLLHCDDFKSDRGLWDCIGMNFISSVKAAVGPT